ncbi:MAG: hypothetical protein CL944_01360 [Candidatus Diapherotrites archaeon]|uniref:Uncharacterized protein n=1 Tax=Candidatus Iainarchaeum sp. TaxID=3101447 RepID=A0A2D6LPH9_9ARCH|nr:hypothetical protein [Candidatus Diapherotrites archaeon]|tara:strand:+ start:1582 stop:2010 length:429 start_codon:yes stop_codon:yes gene_type:complete
MRINFGFLKRLTKKGREERRKEAIAARAEKEFLENNRDFTGIIHSTLANFQELEIKRDTVIGPEKVGVLVKMEKPGKELIAEYQKQEAAASVHQLKYGGKLSKETKEIVERIISENPTKTWNVATRIFTIKKERIELQRKLN